MGVTFRSGGYIRYVRIGGRTIKEGEAAAIWNAEGIHTQIIGPKRVWLWYSTIRFLTRHKAESHQYLRISYRDGRVDHIVGPAVIYENPALHDNVRVEDGLRLSSDTQFVVTFSSSSSSLRRKEQESDDFDSNTVATHDHEPRYDDDDNDEESPTLPKKTKAASKRVIYGPTLFIPKPNEYVQSFSWSGFTKSQIFQTSGTASFDVTVPTSDGFTFDVSLIISFNMASVDKLVAKKDPIQELLNGIRFDSQTIGDGIPSTLLKCKKEDIVTSLSQTKTFPSLLRAANNCGLNVETIQVTSISLCSALKTEIQSEQKLSASIQAEVAKKRHSHQLLQMEMQAQQRHIEEESELKKKEVKINDELDLESHKLKLAALDRKMALAKFEAEGMRTVMKEKEDSILEFLTKVKEMDVDMTKFMTTYGGIHLADKVLGNSEMLRMDESLKNGKD